MRTLYDSESFAVLHLLSDVPHDGSLPEMFQQRIEAWQERTPTQEEVEDALEGYAELAQNPVIVH